MSELFAAAPSDYESLTPFPSLTLFPLRHGEYRLASMMLARAAEVGVAVTYDAMVQNPGYAPLLHDPLFADVVERSLLRTRETIAMLEAARSRGELPGFLEQPLRELARDLP